MEKIKKSSKKKCVKDRNTKKDFKRRHVKSINIFLKKKKKAKRDPRKISKSF